MARNKTMSAKRFWQILEDANIPQSVFGYEGILNMVSAFEQRQAEEAQSLGCLTIAEDCRKRAEVVYKALEDIGFYDSYNQNGGSAK